MSVYVAVCKNLASKNGLTMKTGLGFVQGHWKYTTLFHHKYDMVVEKQAKTSNK